MRTVPQTSIQIRNNQLVVGGFFVGGWEIPDKHYYAFHNGDVDVGSVYQREVTLTYKLERDQFRYAHPGDFLAINEPQRIPNQDRVQINRQELRQKIQDFSKPWYYHSSGTVSRKPMFPGQEPAKNVVVVKPFSGGYRRGELPVISVTPPRSLKDATWFNRKLNHGLSAADIADINRPINIPSEAITMRFNDYVSRAGGPLRGIAKEVMENLLDKTRKHIIDNDIKVVLPKGPLH